MKETITSRRKTMDAQVQSTPGSFKNRKFPRTDINLRVDFRVCGDEAKKERAHTGTLGEGGLMMSTGKMLSEGSRVEMNLYYNSIVIPFDAEVVWVEPFFGDGSPRFRCGVQYIKKAADELMHIQYIVRSTGKTSSKKRPPSENQ
ncbi:MAG: PilZ domain-containing protein [Nitrospirae bacterium]|nr:PilZ domain-containing protein [Nitrospirota bacterium]